jgi:hypothetical protein
MILFIAELVLLALVLAANVVASLRLRYWQRRLRRAIAESQALR